MHSVCVIQSICTRKQLDVAEARLCSGGEKMRQKITRQEKGLIDFQTPIAEKHISRNI